MSTINAILDPSPDGTLHLPVPAAWRHLAIKVTAELQPVAPPQDPAKTEPWNNLRGFGCLHGKIWMAPGFDEPLEDFKDYVE